MAGGPNRIDANIMSLSCLRQLNHLAIESASRGLRGHGLAVLPGLRSLTIAGAGANADALLPRVARGLTRLTVLELHSCREFGGAGFASLAGLSTLVTLKLHDCEQFTAAGMHSVSLLRRLQELNARGRRRTGGLDLAVALQGMVALRRLGLHEVRLQRSPRESEMHLPALRSLDISTVTIRS